jgi:capsular polysaccharide biosynthesis protein
MARNASKMAQGLSESAARSSSSNGPTFGILSTARPSGQSRKSPERIMVFSFQVLIRIFGGMLFMFLEIKMNESVYKN